MSVKTETEKEREKKSSKVCSLNVTIWWWVAGSKGDTRQVIYWSLLSGGKQQTGWGQLEKSGALMYGMEYMFRVLCLSKQWNDNDNMTIWHNNCKKWKIVHHLSPSIITWTWYFVSTLTSLLGQKNSVGWPKWPGLMPVEW